jgi:hypothetical protein
VTAAAPLSHIEIHFGETFWMAVAGFLFIRAIVSRDAKYGLLAGFLAAILAPLLFHGVRHPFAVIEIGLAVMVLHSIRWDDKLDRHSKIARMLLTSVWLLNSVTLACSDYAHSYWAVFIAGLLVFIAALIARWISGFWVDRIIAFAALGTMAMPAAFKSAGLLDTAPVGLVVLLASFVLFAAGITTALLRSRWLAKAADGRIVSNL